MGTIEIIQLPPEQWRSYREIRLEALREEPQAFGSTYADMTERPPDFWQGRLTDAAQGEKSWLLFAREDGRLVGIIGAFWDEERNAAVIISVYVNQAARGKGVGKALMEAILAKVGERAGICRAMLEVNQEQAAAVRLYRQFGFEVIAEKEEVQGDGKNHRGFVMEKMLE